MLVNFYRTGDNPNVFNKSLQLIAENVDCQLKEPLSVDAPSLFTTGDLTGVNYAYIPHFGRYYFVYPRTGYNMTTRYDLESDPLMSFKDAILASPAVIARNPWHFDMYVPDPKLPIEARSTSSIINFPNNPFNGNDNSYILTTIGG